MKVNDKIYEKETAEKYDEDEMQMRFMPGRGTIDAIFIWYLLTWEKRLIVFQEMIWWALRR